MDITNEKQNKENEYFLHQVQIKSRLKIEKLTNKGYFGFEKKEGRNYSYPTAFYRTKLMGHKRHKRILCRTKPTIIQIFTERLP